MRFLSWSAAALVLGTQTAALWRSWAHFADGTMQVPRGPEEYTVEVRGEIAYVPAQLETEAFSKGQIMASKTETNETGAKSAAAPKTAVKADKQEVRAQRKEARAQKAAEAGRPDRGSRLCMFSHVDVKKSEAGYQFSLKGGERRFKFTLAPQEVVPVLKDLESAIQVVRGQL